VVPGSIASQICGFDFTAISLPSLLLFQLFFLYFFRSLFFSNSISIYSSNGSVNMFATLYELSNSSSIVKLYSVRNLHHVINFFKLSLFKFDFSASKSYVIALQLEKNQHSFNAP
jgi:hypothetical protein